MNESEVKTQIQKVVNESTILEALKMYWRERALFDIPDANNKEVQYYGAKWFKACDLEYYLRAIDGALREFKRGFPEFAPEVDPILQAMSKHLDLMEYEHSKYDI